MNPDEKAATLQRQVRLDELDRVNRDLDDGQVRQAVVHAREDLVLVVSYLASITRLLGSIKWLLLVIAVATVAGTVALVRLLPG